MYFSFVLPSIEYANIIWRGACITDLDKVERLHIDGMRLITGATKRSNRLKLYAETSWLTIRQRIDIATLIMTYKIVNNQVPIYLSSIFPIQNRYSKAKILRNSEDIGQSSGKYIRLLTFK